MLEQAHGLSRQRLAKIAAPVLLFFMQS